MGLKTSGRYLDMIRKERNNEKGRQPLPADCGGWDSYREAVSYIIRQIWKFEKFVIISVGQIKSEKYYRQSSF